MIDGITVIKTSAINAATKNNWFPLSMLFIALAIIVLVLVVYKIIVHKINRHCIATFALVEIFSVFLGVTLLLSSFHPYVWNEYTVKISDSVSFKQFTEKYCIVSQTDDIYVIVDKKDRIEYNN